MVKNRDRQPGVFSVHEAKTQLSRLLDQVLANGEPVLIGRRGKAEVMLAPLDHGPKPKRTAGMFRSVMRLSGDLPPSPQVQAQAQAQVGTAQGYLLTPQSLVRWLASSFELSTMAHDILDDASSRVFISTEGLRQVLAWAAEGTLDLGALKGRLAAACTSQGFEILTVQPETIERAASLNGDVDAALCRLNELTAL